ncbi:mitochondrial fission ELM1 family protein [Porticoccus sp.]
MDKPADDQRPDPVPITWLILGDKQGDNSQVETLIEGLGWPHTRKYVHMRDEFVLGKPKFRATLDHLDLSHSDALEAPWPDLIFTVGRRPSMVALWVREQSGNRTRIILVGKPTGNMPDFDLVIASSENQLPPLDNLVPITLPLMKVDPAKIAAEAERWNSRLAALPRPLVAILVGGETGPFVMNEAIADKLAAQARHIQNDLGGTAYVTTSRRTKPEVVQAIKRALPQGTPFFAWSADAGDNPYKALLGTADGFIVTGDSISMMVEVILMHKPLAIFPLSQGFAGTVDQLRRSLIRRLFNPRCETTLDRLRQRLARFIFRFDRFKLLSSTRDFNYFHRMLIKQGLAVWAGETLKLPVNFAANDLDRVVTRINGLFEPSTNAD